MHPVCILYVPGRRCAAVAGCRTRSLLSPVPTKPPNNTAHRVLSTPSCTGNLDLPWWTEIFDHCTQEPLGLHTAANSQNTAEWLHRASRGSLVRLVLVPEAKSRTKASARLVPAALRPPQIRIRESGNDAAAAISRPVGASPSSETCFHSVVRVLNTHTSLSTLQSPKRIKVH